MCRRVPVIKLSSLYLQIYLLNFPLWWLNWDSCKPHFSLASWLLASFCQLWVLSTDQEAAVGGGTCFPVSGHPGEPPPSRGSACQQ